MFRRSLAVSLLLLLVTFSTSRLRAQEMTTDAERSWAELRNSQDVKRKLLADRWRNVTRQQDWGDATGKFKTSAKYVEHDPQLAWVKLRVIQGTGSKRVVKDVQIPLEKLSKTCQSRVRQIATLSEKIAAAIEEEKKAAEDDEAGTEGGGREMMDESRGGVGETEDGMAGIDVVEPAAETRGEILTESRATETAAEPPVTNNGPPLPPVIPRVPGAPLEGAPESDQLAPPVEAAVESPPPASDESWRTSYEAFRENITPPDRSQPTIGWGAMQQLAAAHDTMSRHGGGPLDEAALAEVKESLAAAGEVTWDATLSGPGDESGDWTSALNLPPLQDPMTIRFVLERERDPGPWQNRQSGEQVRFIGRFFEFEGPTGIVVAIRFVPPIGEAVRERR